MGTENRTFKIMSFNMLFGGYEGTDFSLEKRKEKIIDVIKKEKPDIIGCQEVTDSTRDWLESLLFNEYSTVGVGRNSDCRGEGCPVFYNKSKFALISFDTFWLSDDPFLPGSLASNKGQSPCPRLAHILYLRCYEDGCPIIFLNTHLDNFTADCRKFELEIIEKRLREIPANMCCIMTGDLNLEPGADYFEKFLKNLSHIGLKDATSNISGTFHNFGRLEEPMKIDYILTNAPVISSQIVEDKRDGGIWYSDHYAVTSLIKI